VRARAVFLFYFFFFQITGNYIQTFFVNYCGKGFKRSAEVDP